MPYFEYKALRATGEEVLGGLEAGSAEFGHQRARFGRGTDRPGCRDAAH